MDPAELLPGLAETLKAHLRPSDEPRDLAFWMVRVMVISVWFTLLMLPLGAIVFIGPPIVDFAQDILGERLTGTIFAWVVGLGMAVVVGLIVFSVAFPFASKGIDRKVAANDELYRQFIEAFEMHMALHPHAHIEFVETVDPEERNC